MGIGVLEATVFLQDESKEPGNFGNPLPWWEGYSDEMRARELNNGRIAMFAAMGQIAAGLYTGKDAMQQFGFWGFIGQDQVSFLALPGLAPRNAHLRTFSQ